MRDNLIGAASSLCIIASLSMPFFFIGRALANDSAAIECERDFSLDKATRFEICRTEAEQGHSDAQLQLAYMYSTGDVVEMDDDAAIYWFERAIEQDNEWAMAGLASLLFTNLQLRFMQTQENPKTEEFAKIVDLWMRSAAKGVPESMLYAATWYEGEREHDPVKAYMYYYMYHEQGARDGFDLESESLKALAAKLSPAEIEQAVRRAEAIISRWEER